MLKPLLCNPKARQSVTCTPTKLAKPNVAVVVKEGITEGKAFVLQEYDKFY